MSCPANVRETKIAFGFVEQTDLVTANAVADLWSLTKTNPALSVVNANTENDAADIGKGNEFPTQTFKTSMDTAVPIEKYTSSEFAAWLFCFTTGNATKVAAGTGWKYEAHPSDPVVDCLDLPPFTYAEQIRTPPDSVVDRACLGMVIQDWGLTMESGPGRANCRMTANFVGTGSVDAPSGITPWPAVYTEHFLNAASAQITINGIDYIALKTFISLEMRWNNNVRLDTGFYPGSGTNSQGFGVRGRMEYGMRECSLSFVARALAGSAEYVNLFSQTPSTANIKLTGALIDTTFYHSLEIDIPKMVTAAVVNGEQDGIVTVAVNVTILQDPAQPYVKLIATTTKDAILGL
jgi:hypothetical protein